MSAHDLAEKYNVSVKLIRRMIKGGDIENPGKDDLASQIRFSLSKNDDQLSVEQLLLLHRYREIIYDLGARKGRARQQLRELGDVKADAAPPSVSACIRDSAGGDPKSTVAIMTWAKTILPPGPVRYQWLGARLIFVQGPFLRKSDFNHLARALQNVRAHSGFEGWWSKTRVGSQYPTIYHRPKLVFDL